MFNIRRLELPPDKYIGKQVRIEKAETIFSDIDLTDEYKYYKDLISECSINFSNIIGLLNNNSGIFIYEANKQDIYTVVYHYIKHERDILIVKSKHLALKVLMEGVVFLN